MYMSNTYYQLTLKDSYREAMRKKFKTYKEMQNAIKDDKTCLKLQGININKKHKTEKEALAMLEKVDGYEPDMFYVAEMMDIGF